MSDTDNRGNGLIGSLPRHRARSRSPLRAAPASRRQQPAKAVHTDGRQPAGPLSEAQVEVLSPGVRRAAEAGAMALEALAHVLRMAAAGLDRGDR